MKNYASQTGGYVLQFKGDIYSVNRGLQMFEYKPTCPFDAKNQLTVNITATPDNGKGTGQIVSADMGQSVEIIGSGQHTILQK